MTVYTRPRPPASPATTGERHSLRWLTQPAHPDNVLTSHTGQDSMLVPLWEWTIARDDTGASAGISHTRHGAIQALTTALTHARRPRTGHIAPVLLTGPVHQSPSYLRGRPDAIAVYDGRAIQWT